MAHHWKAYLFRKTNISASLLKTLCVDLIFKVIDWQITLLVAKLINGPFLHLTLKLWRFRGRASTYLHYLDSEVSDRAKSVLGGGGVTRFFARDGGVVKLDSIQS